MANFSQTLVFVEDVVRLQAYVYPVPKFSVSCVMIRAQSATKFLKREGKVKKSFSFLKREIAEGPLKEHYFRFKSPESARKCISSWKYCESTDFLKKKM